MNYSCVIIVPLYKEYKDLDETERKSFCHCVKVFCDRDIALLTYGELDLSPYLQQIDKDVAVAYFDKMCFTSIQSYNDLMLSSDFYKRFIKYDYMLIYQLDAYVFEDKLDYWMSKNYDYVGAPWFENYGSYEDGNQLWEVGNGGLSLRKVKFYYKLLSYRGVLYTGICVKGGFYHFIKSMAKTFGYHNTIAWHLKHIKASLNEDCFLTYYLRKITNKPTLLPSIPSPLEAIDFAFEKSPSYLYEMNGKKLPMGCHAFMKYEYEEFWSKYICDEINSNNN